MDHITKHKGTDVSPVVSMTGIGRASLEKSDTVIEVVIKSVNHRGLDIKYRLPDFMPELEIDLNSVIAKIIKRGRLDIEVTVDNPNVEPFTVAEEALSPLLVHMETLKQRFPHINFHMNVSDLLNLRISQAEPKKTFFDHKNLLIEVVQAALTDFKKSRLHEGALLQNHISEMLKLCKELVYAIKNLAEQNIGDRFLAFRSRAKELFADLALNEERLYQEMALLVQRADFKEEIDRLTAHFDHFDEVLTSADLKGRKLDFLCQEMLRESTTLLSKANDHRVMVAGIELKAHIERIKEQVQNIE